MILGQIEGKLSRKHQVALPKEYREELGETVIVTKGFNTFLQIIAKKNWKVLLEGTSGKPFTDQSTRDLQRYLFGNAVELRLDQQGRMLLPTFLLEHAKLQKDIIFIGVERYVELWDVTLFRKYDQSVSKAPELLTIDLTRADRHE
ncbi:division/cell wall cluster transcriptional repressor MraZ [soil metagenome]